MCGDHLKIKSNLETSTLLCRTLNRKTVCKWWLNVPHTKCRVPRDEERGTMSPALRCIYSLTIQLKKELIPRSFQDYYFVMNWRDSNKTCQILTAAEKGGYGVLAAIV